MNILAAINKTSQLAEKHKKAENLVRKLFEKRYGSDFSDVDCDPLIDTCGGQGSPYSSLAELDEMVKQYCDLEPIL
jgi:hypothetical protein